jgi:hypothetical protein
VIVMTEISVAAQTAAQPCRLKRQGFRAQRDRPVPARRRNQ